mmetsp:Transcript_12273/g.11105  ORF Transcript_12273/g.11105 Transcript_12273/m.11105 type:complete len:832 (+) Transcript_12273:78-2573(+)
MSRFYQRYLSGVKKPDANKTENSIEKAPVNRPVDPTSQTTLKAPHPVNRRGSNAATAIPSTNNQHHSRRVEIFNPSEAFSPDTTKQLQVFAKPETSRIFLKNSLSNHYLFESLEEEDMNKIVDCMRPTFASIDESIIRQGDIGDLFFCLEIGSAVATVDNKEVFAYEPGGCFGELALIYNSPRAASVIAKTACKLWALDLKTFRYILATTSSSKMVRRCEFLKKCTFLDALNNEQISKLAGALEEASYTDGQFIIKQGDVGNSFFIIEEGNVRCTQIKSSGKEVDLITLKEGDYFGEMALMLNETRHANCIASNKVKCLTLDRNKFYMLLGSVQEVLAQRMRIRILQSVPLLSRLSEYKLSKLSSVMRVQSFNDGAYIIRQGEEGSRFYIINEGEVRCTRATSNTQEEELIRLTPLEFFGERALITNEVRKANVIACGAVECLVLERSNFQSLLADVHDDIVNEITRRETSSDENNKSTNSTNNNSIVTAGPVTNFQFNDLQVMRTVGTGTFGRVKLVQHKATKLVYALKCMNKSEIIASHQERNIMNEKNLLFECINCPFILKLLQTYNYLNQIFMLMEFIQGGELWSYIYEKLETIPRNSISGFTLDAVKFYSANVILAFKYLHNKGIGYRDLKPENLLLDEFGYIKVIDFGFAKKFPYYKNDQKLDKTYTLCGTPEYLAPEIVMSKGYDRSVDYWALGCLIYELYLTKTPFQADYTTKIFQNIVSSEKCLTFPTNTGLKMDNQHMALIKKLLCVNPAFRLGNLSGGVDDIIRDPFYSSLDWDGLINKQVKAPYIPNITNPLDSSNFDEYDEDDTVPEYTGDQIHFQDF